MIDLAVFLKRSGYGPDQVQDFIPAPFDIATACTTPASIRSRESRSTSQASARSKLQRALMQYFKPENYIPSASAAPVAVEIGCGPVGSSNRHCPSSRGLDLQSRFMKLVMLASALKANDADWVGTAGHRPKHLFDLGFDGPFLLGDRHSGDEQQKNREPWAPAHDSPQFRNLLVMAGGCFTRLASGGRSSRQSTRPLCRDTQARKVPVVVGPFVTSQVCTAPPMAASPETRGK